MQRPEAFRALVYLLPQELRDVQRPSRAPGLLVVHRGDVVRQPRDLYRQVRPPTLKSRAGVTLAIVFGFARSRHLGCLSLLQERRSGAE